MTTTARELAEEIYISTFGTPVCVCDPAYKMRKRTDPSCNYCEYFEYLTDKIVAAIQQVETEALASKVEIDKDDLETIEEIADLMEAVREGEYEPDSFTNQNINQLIKRLRSQLTLAPKEQAISECKLQGHKGGWDENGNAYCTTCDRSAPNEQVIRVPIIGLRELESTMLKNGFDHPCRKTCSGWTQGYDRGRFDFQEAIKRLNKQARIEESDE